MTEEIIEIDEILLEGIAGGASLGMDPNGAP